MVTYSELQHPRLKGEKAFQDFCLLLLQHEWNDGYARLHGRSGQAQHGADITGSDNRNGYDSAACQCKGSEKNEPRQISEEELEEEVKKAKKFDPKLDILIVAYAGERDQKLQRKAIALNLQNKKEGLFKVELWSWDDMVERAESYPAVRQELLIQNQYVLPPTLDPRRPQSGAYQNVTAIASHQETSLLRMHGEDSTRPAEESVEDAKAEAKIDAWRDQIMEGSGKSVIKSLRTFLKDTSANYSAHIRFRVHANLGAALIQDGQIERAAVEFEEAAKAEPDTAASAAFLGRAYFIRGRKDEAFEQAEKALKKDPKNLHAASLLISTAPNEITCEELEERLGELAEHVDVGSSLTERYSETGQHEKALEIARKIKIEDNAAAQNLAVGQAIISKLQHNLYARIGAKFSDEDQALAEEARDRLAKAWSAMRERADKDNWVFVGANLVGALRLTGEHDKADALALEVYQLKPDQPDIAERGIVAMLHLGEKEQALKAAEKLVTGALPTSYLLAADVAAWAQDWTKLKDWAEQAYQSAENDEQKAHAAELVVYAHYRQSDAAAALSKADELRPTIVPSVSFESRVAELARRDGDQDRLEAARKVLNGFQRDALDPIERFDLANAFADDGEWAKAAELLEGLYDVAKPSPPLGQRLFYLFRADLRAQARELYESLQGEALDSIQIHRLGAAAYERSGMLPEALKALSAAMKIEPKDLRSRLDWARICLRNNEEKRVASWIKKADLDFEGDAEDWMELAQLLDRYKRREEALALGYQTIREHWAKSEQIHLQYMSLFLMHPLKEDFLEPDRAGVDTVVTIKSANGEIRTHRIEDDAPPDPVTLATDHPFARLLTGKSVGDVVISDGGIGQQESWEIISISHKFVDLFRKAMNTHDTIFPGSTSLGRVQINPNAEDGFEPIFEQARRRAKLADNVSELYRDKVIPLDIVAKTLGIDIIDASRGLRFKAGITLEACGGTPCERTQALQEMSGSTRVIVDTHTLALWEEIGLLEILERIKTPEIVIVQATLDDLVQRCDEAKQELGQDGGSLEAAGDKFALIEPSKAQKKEQLRQQQNLLSWSRAHLSIVPSEACEALNTFQEKGLLLDSSIDMLGTAIASDIPAIIEDGRVRLIGRESGLKASCWTQAFLIHLLEKGEIERRQYTQLIAKLHRHNVGFVCVTIEDLLICLEGEVDAHAFEDIADALLGPNVEIKSLVNVLLGFFEHLWISSRFAKVRRRFTGIILRKILNRDDGIALFKHVCVRSHRHLSEFAFPRKLSADQFETYLGRFITGHFLSSTLEQSE
ncbi:hypothetical protein GFK91_06680 [Roseibium aggregatum]|uniref:PIN domain-containing protein n=1 Tax=Roseibium aggregatum TaxID=187304 RepID=UPI001E3B2DC7|nr:hypothetical protein [Roseibium aggregatum]UES55318.1 hypothetical protein GFK91_06680 [Roseibium aggregatum]